MNYYQKLGALLFCLILTACSSKDVSDAKKAIESELLDPGSVKYRNIIIKKKQSFASMMDAARTGSEGKPNYATVCGEVNAKNRMGGYTGFKPFIYNRSGNGTLDIDNVSLEAFNWYCVEATM